MSRSTYLIPVPTTDTKLRLNKQTKDLRSVSPSIKGNDNEARTHLITRAKEMGLSRNCKGCSKVVLPQASLGSTIQFAKVEIRPSIMNEAEKTPPIKASMAVMPSTQFFRDSFTRICRGERSKSISMNGTLSFGRKLSLEMEYS